MVITGNLTAERTTVPDDAMNASFLRASLFTSVVAYGVAAFAVGLGIVPVLLGVAVRALDQGTAGSS